MFHEELFTIKNFNEIVEFYTKNLIKLFRLQPHNVNGEITSYSWHNETGFLSCCTATWCPITLRGRFPI